MNRMSISSGLHFLIVDDAPIMRRIVVISLNALGYTKVSEAEDGEQALKLLHSADALAAPINFVVTDWDMPVMDGMTLLRTIRASTDLKHLPVLMTSGQTEEDCFVFAARAGADGYVAKPLNATNLKAALEGILSKREWEAHQVSILRV